MLVLSRKPQETIVIDGRISITVVEVRGNQVRLGIEAPRELAIQRQELLPLQWTPASRSPQSVEPGKFRGASAGDGEMFVPKPAVEGAVGVTA